MRLERRLGYQTKGRRLHASARSRVQTPLSANFFSLVLKLGWHRTTLQVFELETATCEAVIVLRSPKGSFSLKLTIFNV